MKKLIATITIRLIILSAGTQAQTLPNVQEISVYAPSAIKIDGKATEWDNEFKAHNNATDLYYTLSNDDKNLYLTVRARYHNVIEKILRGGITLTINHYLSKKDDEHVSITYPVLRGMDQADLTDMMLRKVIEHGDDFKKAVNVNDINEMMANRSKSIKVAGIKAITDEISVYNQEEIKAAAKFDGDTFFTYELSVPLKY